MRARNYEELMKKDYDSFKHGSHKMGDKVQELKDVLKGKAPVMTENDNDNFSGESPDEFTDEGLQSKVKALEEQLALVQETAALQKDQALRMMADFENAKKRLDREKDEMVKYSNEKILNELFPILDNLEMTVFHARTGKADLKDPFIEGVELVIKQFVSTLDKFGVEVVAGVGLPFNPHVQEAIGHEDSASVPAGYVTTVHRKGYLLNKRLVRPASVSIAKEAVEPEVEEPTVH